MSTAAPDSPHINAVTTASVPSALDDLWNLDDEMPRHNAATGEILHFAVRCAILAPSSHNSQPWQFKILKDGLLLIRDRSRSLQVVDPYDRELIISCGAALFNIRVALAHVGISARFDVLPDPLDEDLLVRVTVDHAMPVGHDDLIAPLLSAIPKRVTNRSRFSADALSTEVISKLQQAANTEWAKLSVAISVGEREAIAALVAAADLTQFSDERFRHELASWLHPSRSHDGLAAFSDELEKTLDFATPLVALVVRTFDLGNGRAAHDKALAEGSPLLACISTATDDAPAWLMAGQALQRVLLTAAQEGLAVSYLNQPIEVETARSALAALMHTERFPQLLLRVGLGVAPAHSPRRKLADVIS